MTSPLPKRAAIDTQILIYSLKQCTGDADTDDMILRAGELIRTLIKNDCTIVISMITLAEYLVKVDEANRFSTAQHLASTFELAPFSLKAAMIASGLVPYGKKLVSGDRDIIMADTKIIGSIAAANCQVVYTHDTHSKFAQICQHVPLPVQGLPAQMMMALQAPEDQPTVVTALPAAENPDQQAPVAQLAKAHKACTAETAQPEAKESSQQS